MGLKRKQYFCPKCGQDKGFLITKRIAGISPEDRPCRDCRTKIVSEKNKGRSAWNRGIPLKEETKQKLRAANLGKPSPTKGKVVSKETRIKLSCINRGIAIDDFDEFTTSANDSQRVVLKKTNLRQLCFEKVNFVCVSCKERGGILNAHHLDNFADYPELRFELSNLVCLCVSCHKTFHARFGTKHNTKHQFNQFLEDKNV